MNGQRAGRFRSGPRPLFAAPPSDGAPPGRVLAAAQIRFGTPTADGPADSGLAPRRARPPA